MGIAPKSFAGISTNIPDVYTKSEFPPSAGAAGAVTNIVAVIGSCNGGVPYNGAGLNDEEKFSRISSVAQGLDVLRGGAAMHMAEFYLTPTKDPALGNPTQVLVFRVDPATQAVNTLEDGSSNDIIDLNSTRWGTLGNQLARKVEAATNLGHKVTIKFQGTTITEQDDVGLEYLAIQYTGAGSAAVMNITATQLDIAATAAPADDLTLLFTDYVKLGDLVEYINEQANYTCRLLSASNTDTTTFDAVTGQDIKTAEYTAVAHVEALIQFFNSQSQGEVEAALTTAAVRTDVANDANFVFMASGTKGVESATDWAAALTLMEKFKINHVLAATGNTTYHAMVDAHLRLMSSIENKRNRSGGSGAAAAATLATRLNETKVLNSARFEYHMTPFKRADITNDNVLTSFEAFYGAALTAGIRFGNDVTISAVFKTLNVLALDETYDTPTKKQIIAAGGSLFDTEERGFVVRHNLSTYQGQNLILNLPSMLRTADAITLDSQVKIQTRLAAQTTAANSLIVADMKNYLLTNLLPGYRDDQHWITNDPITGEPAFSDVEFTLEGDAFYFSFTGIIPAPMHFVFVKQKFVVPGSTQ